MTLKELLSVMCPDCTVSIWREPDDMDLLEAGTVQELLYGDEEEPPKLSEELLNEEVLWLEPYRSCLSSDGIRTGIYI